jgi:Tol biopolymer transport system component/DNA-binding winged helix-turn-helix (wHTH) protein
MSIRFSHLYEFGPFRLDATERLLWRDGETVRLTPKEFETLLALVRNSGHVMTKGELLKEVWPDTFVEEATLAQNIFTLRKALGRGATEGEQQYIETVPRRGYRFVAGVWELKEEAAEATAAEATAADAAPVGTAKDEEPSLRHAAPDEEQPLAQNGPEAGGRNGHGRAAFSPVNSRLASEARAGTERSEAERGGHPTRAAVLIALAVVLTFAAAVFLVFKFVVRRQTAPEQQPRVAFQSMQVTRLPVTGEVREAVISPDGKYVAYVANGPDQQSIWIKQVGANSAAQQIVPPTAATFYGALAFAPGGDHVYYVAYKFDSLFSTLYQVPLLGGSTKRILDNVHSPITFAPDGKRFAFVRVAEQSRALIIANADGSGERELAAHKFPELFGLPAWSPDGKTIACVRGTSNSYDFNYVFLGLTAINVADGVETSFTPQRWMGVSQISWLPDSSGLLMSAAERELSPSQIWRVSYPTGAALRVTNDLNIYLGASMTADAGALATVQTDRAPNIWVAPGGDTDRAEQITTGTGKLDGIYGVSWTPDGKIVYASVASGNWDIWIMNADGTGQRQLTVDARSNYGPSVAADGRHIVFISNRAGGPFNVWRMDIDGKNQRQLTFGKGENFAHISPDGKWVVYATISYAERNLIWKVPFDGGEPVALTDKPSSWPFVSPDGKWVACTYTAEQNGPTKIAIVPFGGGPPAKLFDIETSFRANTVWLPDGRGVAFIDNRSGTPNIWLQPINGGKPTQLTDFKSNGVVSFDWSRDNRLVATRSVENTSIVLIRDFK